jgi:hypothetical protein
MGAGDAGCVLTEKGVNWLEFLGILACGSIGYEGSSPRAGNVAQRTVGLTVRVLDTVELQPSKP